MTTNLRLYAAPVALLIMAGGLAAPHASADPAGAARTVSAPFAYDRTAPAEQIYADLRHAAERLCVTPGPRPLYLRKVDQACVDSVIGDAIGRIGRIDVADLHGRVNG